MSKRVYTLTMFVLLADAVFAQKTPDEVVDLRHIPQLSQTPDQHAQRMQWFRDAKFGMFIHWGPCSIGQKEIGWGREANRPWDINADRHGPRTADPVYDNYYKQFNPTNYNADAWVSFAKESGMKYMVLIAKHHDGFSLFDSKVTDYDMMASPYGKDVVKEFAEACHRQDMRLGLYYSTRDWYHPDYLVGDNKAYDVFYRSQIEELLTQYGDVDIMWFDHVGGQDRGKWRIDELFSMMYRLHPNLIVNNRSAKYCGNPAHGGIHNGPVTPEIATIGTGDYYTPEGRIGSMDILKDWESCIHVGKGWSYRGEDDFKGPEDCIRMLSSTTTGGGNLLLNFGPRPDGTFAQGEAAVAKAMGKWLKINGDAVYGTRGGPYKNGPWGGSCHKGNKLYLHIAQPWQTSLSLDPLPSKIVSARMMNGAPAEFTQSDEGVLVTIQDKDWMGPVTVVELSLESPLQEGVIIGGARETKKVEAVFGNVISSGASLELSSRSSRDRKRDHGLLFTAIGSPHGFAFETQKEMNPWAKIDLGSEHVVNAVKVVNSAKGGKNRGLILSSSEDGETWTPISQATTVAEEWMVPVTRFHAGINAAGRSARYLKLELKGNSPRSLLLHRVRVFGEK